MCSDEGYCPDFIMAAGNDPDSCDHPDCAETRLCANSIYCIDPSDEGYEAALFGSVLFMKKEEKEHE